MDKTSKKPMLTPLDEASEAAWRGRGEQRPPKPQVGATLCLAAALAPVMTLADLTLSEAPREARI